MRSWKLFYALFLALLLCSSGNSYAQGEGNNWYFGHYAGITFSTNPPSALTDGAMLTSEGCSSISDFNGNLLFYTDGSTVWDKTHQVMPNGSGLLGDASSTQSGIIVPHTGDPDIYYIFTVDDYGNSLMNGFRYSKVDLSLNGGNGDIIAGEKNIRLIGSNAKVVEKVTAVKHGYLAAFWVITHGWENNNFYVFKIDDNGINTTPQIYSIGSIHEGAYSNARGYLKVSPNGDLIAVALANTNHIELFDFNNQTGEVSNPRFIEGISNPYGLEFSPDQSKLYATEFTGRLKQIDFSNGEQITTIDGTNIYGGLQMGPDNKVYATRYAQDHLGVINVPNTAGLGCNFVENAVNLGSGLTQLGLPTFIASIFLPPSFSYDNVCYLDQTTFVLDAIELPAGEIIDSVFWDFGDPTTGIDNTAVSTTAPYTAQHVFSSDGNFEIWATVKFESGNTLIPFIKTISIIPAPAFNIVDMNDNISDTFRICYNEQAQFKVSPWPFDQAIWNNGGLGEVSDWYSSTGDISVLVSDDNGCTATKNAYLIVKPEIAFNLSLPDFCQGDAPEIINNCVDLTGGVFSGQAVTYTAPNYYLNPALITGDSVKTYYTYTDSDGCDGTDSVWTKLYSLPNVNLVLDVNSICLNASAITLSGGSPSGGEYVGPGVTGGQFDPNIAGLGAHSIKYGMSDAHSCTDTATDIMMVNPLPDVNFAPIPDICQNQGIIVIDQGTPPSGPDGVGTYSGPQIDGDGNFNSNTAPGIYDLVYEYVENTACADTAQRSLVVLPEPQAATDVSVDVSTYCLNDKPQNITLECIGPDDSYVWYENDFTGSPIGVTKIITITAPDVTTTYLVRSETSCGVSPPLSITVEVKQNPTADFIVDNVCQNDIAVFTDQSTAVGNITSWDWSFDDGSTDNIQNPTHSYTSFGIFNPQLIVNDDQGCSDTIQKSIEVFELPISAFIWSDTSCTAGLLYFMDESYQNQGAIINQFQWSIDGNEFDIQNPNYTFPTVEMSYPVSLAIIDEYGCKDTLLQDVFVEAELMIGYVADTVCLGDSNRFIASILKPIDAEINSWTWQFNDGSDEVITDKDTIYHIFPNGGTFAVELRAIQLESNACEATFVNTIKVNDLPISLFSSQTTVCLDSNLFIDESSVIDAPIVQWHWDFGDGNSSIIDAPENPNIKYLYPPVMQSYQASLVVTDQNACRDSSSILLEHFPCLYVHFYTDSEPYCQYAEVSCMDSTINEYNKPILSKYWDFGDGTTIAIGSDIDTVKHIYEDAGVYTIRFAVNIDVDGTVVSDTADSEITIYSTPISAISAANICDRESALLISQTDANNSQIESFKWIFGDGTEEILLTDDVNNSIEHLYPASGEYPLQLVTTTKKMCIDTAFRNFIVNPLPEVTFSVDSTEFCGSGISIFTDVSSVENGNIISRYWDFGDGGSDIRIEDTISHYFESLYEIQNTDYTVYLTVTSDSNCMSTDSAVDMIRVYSLPIPDFKIRPDSVAVTDIEKIDIINLSDNADYYLWTMADTSIWEDVYEPPIWKEITDTGRYLVQLQARNINGCWASEENYLLVYPILHFFIPTAFSPDDNEINDTFGPTGKYFDNKTYSFYIFTRWGNQIFETNNFYEQWNGRVYNSGDMVANGVYTWIIKLTNMQGKEEVFAGTVTLLR